MKVCVCVYMFINEGNKCMISAWVKKSYSVSCVVEYNLLFNLLTN